MNKYIFKISKYMGEYFRTSTYNFITREKNINSCFSLNNLRTESKLEQRIVYI